VKDLDDFTYSPYWLSCSRIWLTCSLHFSDSESGRSVASNLEFQCSEIASNRFRVSARSLSNVSGGSVMMEGETVSDCSARATGRMESALCNGSASGVGTAIGVDTTEMFQNASPNPIITQMPITPVMIANLQITCRQRSHIRRQRIRLERCLFCSCIRIDSSCRSTSCASRKRSAGFFESNRSTTSASSAGTSLFTSSTGRCLSLQIRFRIASACSARNGGRR